MYIYNHRLNNKTTGSGVSETGSKPSTVENQLARHLSKVQESQMKQDVLLEPLSTE